MDSSDSCSIGDVSCDVGSTHDPIGSHSVDANLEAAALLLATPLAVAGSSEGPKGSVGPACISDPSKWPVTGPSGPPIYTTGPTGGYNSCPSYVGPNGAYQIPRARVSPSFKLARELVARLSTTIPNAREALGAGLKEMSDAGIDQAIGETQDFMEHYAGNQVYDGPQTIFDTVYLGHCAVGDWKKYQGKWWTVVGRKPQSNRVLLRRTGLFGQRQETDVV